MKLYPVVDSMLLSRNNRRLFHMLRSAAAVSAFLIGAPLVAFAQSDGTELLRDTRARTAIQQVLQVSQAKGVPIDPLVRKIREGVAKQSEPALIQNAVQTLAKRLELAVSALSPYRSVDEVTAGANALQVGVPAPTLKELRKLSPVQPINVPLDILTALVGQQVPVKLATQHVRELVARGANSAQLVAMSESVEADVSAGMQPDAALDLRARGVLSLLSAPSAANGVLPSSPIKAPIRPKK